MEPDEAVDALRDLEDDEAAELLDAMPTEKADRLRALLLYREGSAGGVMTTNLVLVRPTRPSARCGASCAARPSTRPTSTR